MASTIQSSPDRQHATGSSMAHLGAAEDVRDPIGQDEAEERLDFLAPRVSVPLLLKEVKLEKGDQAALIPSFAGRLEFAVKSGTAESFGSPLKMGRWTELRYPQRTVVASSDGCVLETKASNLEQEVKVISGDQFPVLVGCAHTLINARRCEAWNRKDSSLSPRVLVVGPVDSGKSSACKALLNYALLADWNPTYVDFDPGQQGLSLPGMFSGYVMQNSLDDEGQVRVADRFDLPYGRTRLNEDTELYLQQVHNMSRYVQNNFEKSPHLAASGVIINTAGWVDVEGIQTLLTIADIFKVNMVLVMESVALGHRFRAWSCKSNHDMEVLFMKQPKDLTIRDIDNRRDYRQFLVRKCFFPREVVVPTFVLPLDQVVFYRLASFHTIVLRNGKKLLVCNQILPAGECLNYVLAISAAPSVQCDVKEFPTLGFAVLIYFKSFLNEACLASTIDLSALTRRPLVLVRTELRGPRDLSAAHQERKQAVGSSI